MFGTASPCVVCGSTRPPVADPILWPGLVAEWQLTTAEAASVDRREGQRCPDCSVGLRSASLAAAIVPAGTTLEGWVSSAPAERFLEINQCGQLTGWLQRLPHHTLVEYPDVDAHALPYDDGTWDTVAHSDTLEHVADPVLALRECLRVFRPGGRLCFTTPVIAGRLTRRRDDLAPSYHGLESDPTYLVVTEYGADFWTQVLDAGFIALTFHPLQWPDAVAFSARKPPGAH